MTAEKKNKLPSIQVAAQAGFKSGMIAAFVEAALYPLNIHQHRGVENHPHQRIAGGGRNGHRHANQAGDGRFLDRQSFRIQLQ